MKLTYFLPSSNLRIGFFTVIGALIAISLCGAEFASAPSIAPQTASPDRDCLVPGLDDHCERWVSIYDNPNGHNEHFFNPPLNGVEEARAQAIGPYGKSVYVTGYSWDNSTKTTQWATVAVDASTGARKWVARHGGFGITSFAYDIAVSPDGTRVYVVGQQYRQQQGEFFSEAVTIAYDTASGVQVWVARYKVPFAGAGWVHVAVSANGKRVYVSGPDTAGGDFGRNEERYVTLAYSADDGIQEWVSFLDHPGIPDSPISMALDGDGSRLYISGTGGVVAYDTVSGRELWKRDETPYYSLATARDEPGLFVVRPRGSINGDNDLVALAPATGATLWRVPLPRDVGTQSLVSDSKGTRVYMAVTQDITSPNGLFQNLNAVTRAFDASSGRVIWTSHYNDPRFLPSGQFAFGLALSPDDEQLYLAASAVRRSRSRTESGTADISTVSYDSGDGSQRWVGRYSAAPNDYDKPSDPFPAQHNIGVTPNGDKVITAGVLLHYFSPGDVVYRKNAEDYVILAYDTAVGPGVRALKGVSRKRHGGAGTFDLRGIECRSGGPDNRYRMVVSFPRAVTFRSAAVTSGTGTVVSATAKGSEVTAKLTGVTNAQTITLTLFDVTDGVETNDVAVKLTVLVGDVSTSGSVDDSDLSLVQGQSGQPVTKVNFREDVDASGSIDGTDASLVESQLNTSSAD